MGKKDPITKKRGMLPFAALFPLYRPGTSSFLLEGCKRNNDSLNKLSLFLIGFIFVVG